MDIYKMTITLLVSTIMITCATRKIAKEEMHTNIFEQSVIDTTGKYSKYYSHGIFNFKCGSKTLTLKSENFNRYDFLESGISKCLYNKGFNGDKNANMQIAALISVVGYKFRDVFFEDQYRGPEIFEALLRRAENPKKRSAHLFYAKRMIKTIDGFSGIDINKYVKKVNGLPELVDVVAKGTKGDPHWHAIYFETIKKAWKAGKIELKAFGEK